MTTSATASPACSPRSTSPMQRDQRTAPPTPRGRVQKVPGHDRQGRTGRPGRVSDLRQLRHPQDPDRAGLAGPPPSVPPALHPPPAPPGSTRWNAGWPSSPTRRSAVAPTSPSKPWMPTSAPGPPTGTPTHDPSSGPTPPKRSSNHSHDFADEFQARDTRPCHVWKSDWSDTGWLFAFSMWWV
jgi:hypothetical protein